MLLQYKVILCARLNELGYKYALSYLHVYEPMQGKNPPFFGVLGIVEGNSEVEIKVTFAPMDFSTAHMKLQVNLLKKKLEVHVFTVYALAQLVLNFGTVHLVFRK